MIKITNMTTGERVQVSRDVCTQHPDWVHEQLGTQSEAELQRALDSLNVSMWYDEDGRHLGPDTFGVEMFCRESNEVPPLQRTSEGEDNVDQTKIRTKI